MNEQCLVHPANPQYTHYYNFLYDEVTGKAMTWPKEELKLHVISSSQWPTCHCKPTVEPITFGATEKYGGVYHYKSQDQEEHFGN